MLFETKGEFIQALKDYDLLKEKENALIEEYRNLNYLRYEKVKSPLDYDVVKYNKKGEAIRQIKGRGSFNSESIAERNEQLEEQMEKLLDRAATIRIKLANIDQELGEFDSPLREILIMRYKENKKLKDVCKCFNLYLDESGMYKFIMRELDKYYE